MQNKIFLKVLFLSAIWIHIGGVSHPSWNSPNFNKAVQDLVNNPKLKPATIGISIKELENQKSVSEYNEQAILIPASTQKLITTLAFLELMPKDFEFTTELLYQGKIVQGILHGHLIIRSNGDPSFASETMWPKGNFNKILLQIKDLLLQQNIKEIKGDILIDESFLKIPPEHPTWQWMDLGNYYGSGSWPINVHDNLYHITFKQKNKIGEIPEIVKIDPEVPGLILKNEVTTAGPNTGDNAYIYGGPFQEYRIIRGTIPSGNGLFTIKGSLPHPAKFLKYHIEKTLNQFQIQIQKQNDHWQESPMITLFKWKSAPINQLLDLANKESNNLVCEAFYNQICLLKSTENQQKYHGKEMIEQWFAQVCLKNEASISLEDGSGLSAKNGISANAFTDWLCHAPLLKSFPLWKKSIPQAGVEGTVKSIGTDLATNSKIYLKSGSLGKVRCYAGYLHHNNGKTYALAILINQHSLKSSELKNILNNFFQKISS